MASLVSSIVVGPNETTEEKLEQIKHEHEYLNKDREVVVKAIRETTEGCAPDCKQVYYSVEVIGKD
jgi:hypothetical protein